MKTNPDDWVTPIDGSSGLTKREYFAGLALNGFCSWDHNHGRMYCDYTSRAKQAVEHADALILELNQKKKE